MYINTYLILKIYVEINLLLSHVGVFIFHHDSKCFPYNARYLICNLHTLSGLYFLK